MSSLARIRFACTHCNRKLRVPAAAAGRALPCPNPECGKPVIVPLPDENGPALPANIPAGPAPATASRPRAMVLIAAALSILSLGAGLSYSLVGARGNPERPGVQAGPIGGQAPAGATADGNRDREAAVSAVPETGAATPPPDGAGSRQKPDVAKKGQIRAARDEQAERDRRNKTLSEYAMLARSHSLEYFYNDRKVVPPDLDGDLPRIRQIAHSDNADIRSVASSIMKAHAMVEEYNKNNAPNVRGSADQYRKAMTSIAEKTPTRNPVKDRLAALRGESVRSDENEFTESAKQGLALFRGAQQQRQDTQSFANDLDVLTRERRRIIFKIAKGFAGPQAETAVGIQLKADAYIPGEAVFRVRNDGSPSDAGYCLTLTNEGENLTHCSIAVIARRSVARRSADADFGPPFALDEFTEAVLQPDTSRAVPDIVGAYYIGKLTSRDMIHFLPLQGKLVAENIERVGVVLFSDQMTVAFDPNSCLLEVRDDYLGQASRRVEDQAAAQPRGPSRSMPAPGRPSVPRSSRRKTATGGAPRRK